MNKCPSFDRCNAPLCPLDKRSLESGLWFPNEPICLNPPRELEWIQTQKKIAKKCKGRGSYFTYHDLRKIKAVRSPRGHNPDNLLAKPV